MKRSLVMVLLLATLGSACGESEQEQALNDVCDARADIQKQVDELSGLTIGTVTVDRVRANLSAIRGDLKKVGDAQADLSDERKQEVESATKEFTSQVQSIASDFGTSLSLNEAEAKLQSALKQLADAYQETLGKVDCS